MLLRTTYETVEEWGAYSNMGLYQKNFMGQMRSGMPGFRERYQNYDMSDLLNTSRLMETGGGVTNRLYFSFLNDAQWRTIARAIKRQGDRTRFSRLVGDRLYRRILTGFKLRADVEAPATDADVDTGFNPDIGSWPKIPPLPKSAKPADLAQGAGRLLAYLQEQGYCAGYELSDFLGEPSGQVKFRAFVREPVNLDATSSLMRTNDDFAPRYDQRILQAFFADNGFECEFTDVLAGQLDAARENSGSTERRIGIRTEWRLRPDPEAGL